MNGTPTFEDFMQTYLPNNQAGAANQLYPAQMGGQNMQQGALVQGIVPAPDLPGQIHSFPPMQGGPQQQPTGGMNGGQMGVGQYSGAPVIGGQPQGQAPGPFGQHPQGGMQMQPGQGAQSNTANQMAQWIAMLQAMRGGAGAPTQPQGISAQTGMGQAPQQFGGPGAIHSSQPMQQPQTLANLIQGTAPVSQPGANRGGPMGIPPQG